MSVYVTSIEEVSELRGVVCGATLLDDHLVRRPRQRRCLGLRMDVAVSLRSLGVRCLHPGGELVDEVLVLASARHKVSPVIVRTARDRTSRSPLLPPPSGEPSSS